MNTRKLLGRFAGMTFGLAALAAVRVSAQLYTFDNAGSISVARYDYGSGTPNGSHTLSWSPLNASGGSGSGSLQLGLSLSTAADVNSYGAFTLDLFFPGQNFSSLSFDLYVAPGSAMDIYNGSGYWETFTRLTDNYNSQSVYN